MDRVRFWKDEAERRWKEGDRKGFAEAEAMIEAYRIWNSLNEQEQAALLHKQKERAA